MDEFPLERVAAITGCDPEGIAAAARRYATSAPGVIPWTPITDQQRNSTSAIRLHCALRALTGSLDAPGGELMHGFHRDIVPESALDLHEALPAGQKAKQLGADTHPAFTYRGMETLGEPARRVWGHEYPNLVSGCYMANPTATFRAMATGEPYPVKAFFTLGNNTLMGFANMQRIHEGLLDQDLVVAVEHLRTPTAQLADFVLPGDAWIERACLSDGFGWTAIHRPSQQAVAPAGECRPVYDFWRGLAVRFGFGEHFPWETVEDMLDHRVAKLGMTFSEFAERHPCHMGEPGFRKYERTGFATPSGKVELASSVLEGLGFDPLPYWRDEPAAGPEYPLRLFTGLRDDPFFQTGRRHIEALRRRCPEPRMFVTAADATRAGLEDGGWAEVSTRQGGRRMRVSVRDDLPDGLVRAPHGWWLPERPEGDGGLSGAWDHADAQFSAVLCGRPRLPRRGAGHPPPQGDPLRGTPGCGVAGPRAKPGRGPASGAEGAAGASPGGLPSRPAIRPIRGCDAPTRAPDRPIRNPYEKARVVNEVRDETIRQPLAGAAPCTHSIRTPPSAPSKPRASSASTPKPSFRPSPAPMNEPPPGATSPRSRPTSPRCGPKSDGCSASRPRSSSPSPPGCSASSDLHRRQRHEHRAMSAGARYPRRRPRTSHRHGARLGVSAPGGGPLGAGAS